MNLSTPLVVDWLLGQDLQFMLLGLIVLGVVILVGRFMLHVAWRLVLLATLVVGSLYLLTSFAPGIV